MLKATSTFSGSERPIYHSAMMSVSQLAHVACVNVSEARTRFPAGLYGDFCQPNDAFITSRLVPLLYKEINGAGSIEDKMVALTALGEIGHESILSVVLPIIKTKVLLTMKFDDFPSTCWSCSSTSSNNRAITLHSLGQRLLSVYTKLPTIPTARSYKYCQLLSKIRTKVVK
jgi:hypothetical protein